MNIEKKTFINNFSKFREDNKYDNKYKFTIKILKKRNLMKFIKIVV